MQARRERGPARTGRGRLRADSWQSTQNTCLPQNTHAQQQPQLPQQLGGARGRMWAAVVAAGVAAVAATRAKSLGPLPLTARGVCSGLCKERNAWSRESFTSSRRADHLWPVTLRAALKFAVIPAFARYASDQPRPAPRHSTLLIPRLGKLLISVIGRLALLVAERSVARRVAA